MAENRTFKFYGLGYGVDPVSITASIGGQQVFSGNITTVNDSIDPFPYPTPAEIGNTVMFTLDNFADLNTDFAGNVPVSITVNSGRGAIFSKIECNWANGYGDADTFILSYVASDQRSNIAIDGNAQSTNSSTGVWDWRVFNGSTITYNLNIDVGSIDNVAGYTGNYIGSFTPLPNTPPAE